MTQTITVSCKLQVHPNIVPEIDKTLERFADACNRILDTAKMEGVINTTKLHHLTDYQVKNATELKANHIHPEPGKSYRSGKKFKCGNCGWEHDADINAGLVISQLGGVFVNHPESSALVCQLGGQLDLLPMNWS